jgi:peptidoglycan/LPS O-acetylase OafA/YrhL
MRIYNRFIITLTLAAGIINALLALLGQEDIQIYFIINIIAYMTITLLYVSFNPRARRAMDGVTVVFFGAFLVIVAIKVVDIISGR